jgi:Na+/proline symporter
MINPYLVIFILLAYFALLIFIARLSSKKADTNDAFFLGNRRSPWYVVSFGMIGASLSGVTFISIPGWVNSADFSYMQMVFGYMFGYYVIASVLLPLYYRLKLTSIYTYLGDRFGPSTYKTGASFFLLSRIIGASFRLFLVAIVLQIAVFEPLGLKLSFVPAVIVTVGLIWLYTNKGGIKTIIWTDMFQTFFMLLAVFITIKSIMNAMDLSWVGVITTVKESDYSQIFFFDDFANNPRNFFKMFLGGAFIAITMTGLDQDMMQKNLSCKTLYESQKNVFWLGVMLIIVNLFFLSLGALLYLFAAKINFPIPEQTDYLYPKLAIGGYLGVFTGIAFIIGLTASAYSSADSALTSLTTSFSIDILGIDKKPEAERVKIRKRVHIGMSIALIVVILLFKAINDDNVIQSLFDAAKYTYGPLLGFFFAGLFTKLQVKDRFIPIVAIAAPVLSYILNSYSLEYFGYQFGFELLIINGIFTVLGMWILRTKKETTAIDLA